MAGMTSPSDELAKAIWIGYRFDLRLAVLIIMPIMLAL
ncbi:uncharacterized protein METZ01_LOCUS375335, partial [marine metagenome]